MTTRAKIAALLLTVLVPMTGALTGCKIIDEKPCMADEYPVRARGGGEMCQKNGYPPQPPYETYPPGYTPTTVPYDNPAPDATDFGWTTEATP